MYGFFRNSLLVCWLWLHCSCLITMRFPRVSSVGAYVCKGRSGWLMPLGEALCENADLQLCIPMKFKRAPPLPPPPGPATCTLLLDMLASNPDARPIAEQLEARVCSALKKDSHWQKVGLRDRNGYNHYSHYMEILTMGPLIAVLLHV